MSVEETAKLINSIVAYCFNDEECVDCLPIIGEWLNIGGNTMCTGMTSYHQPDGWINVKDNLPDTIRPVIIYTEWGGDMCCGRYNTELQVWLDLYGTAIWPVTHWRELPDPPRMEECAK